MTKGGAASYRKGATFERLVRKHYEDHSWLAVRQPQSRSSFDIIAVKGSLRQVIQCKLAGKISKAEKEELLEVSQKHQFSPVLAWKEDGQVKLKYLDEKEEEFTLDSA